MYGGCCGWAGLEVPPPFGCVTSFSFFKGVTCGCIRSTGTSEPSEALSFSMVRRHRSMWRCVLLRSLKARRQIGQENGFSPVNTTRAEGWKVSIMEKGIRTNVKAVKAR